MNITEREWDRMVTLFKEVLSKHKVPSQETKELLAIVGSTKADIVVSHQK
jgi:hemoglobin